MHISQLIDNRNKVINILTDFDIEINKMEVKESAIFIIYLGGINKIIFNKEKQKIIYKLEEEIKDIKFIFK